MKRIIISVFTFIFIALTNASAQDAAFNLGDKAPAPAVSKWVKGEGIKGFEQGKIYVVEFSFIECPPCRKAIPHLTELAEKYKGRVKFISIYTDPGKPTNAAYMERLKKFVDAMGQKMGFDVAADAGEGSMFTQWGKMGGYPTAYVVDRDGNVPWAGNPASLDDILEAVVEGTPEAMAEYKENREKERVLGAKMGEYHRNGKHDELIKIVDSLIELHPNDGGYYALKFSTLLKYKKKEAYDLLRWMLDNKKRLKNFDADHFVEDSYAVENPDYSLALAVADWAIEESEIPAVTASNYVQKALIYMHKGRSVNKECMTKEDMKNAMAMYDKAIEIVADDPKNRSRYEEEKKFYMDQTAKCKY